MFKVLHIDSSVRRMQNDDPSHNSISKSIANMFVETLRSQLTIDEYNYRDIGINPPTFINQDWIGAVFTPEIQQNTQQRKLLSLSDKLIEEVANAPKVKGVNVTLSGGLQRDVMQTSKEQVALIQTFEAITEHSFKLERRGGVSDANVVSSVGTPTLDGFGPYGDGDHTVNERACKKSFINRIALVSKILHAYNGVQNMPESHVA